MESVLRRAQVGGPDPAPRPPVRATATAGPRGITRVNGGDPSARNAGRPEGDGTAGSMVPSGRRRRGRRKLESAHSRFSREPAAELRPPAPPGEGERYRALSVKWAPQRRKSMIWRPIISAIENAGVEPLVNWSPKRWVKLPARLYGGLTSGPLALILPP